MNMLHHVRLMCNIVESKILDELTSTPLRQASLAPPPRTLKNARDGSLIPIDELGGEVAFGHGHGVSSSFRPRGCWNNGSSSVESGPSLSPVGWKGQIEESEARKELA